MAMTRNVVRSNRIASVALHARAKVVRCFESTAAFGMMVCTICDHACTRKLGIEKQTKKVTYLVQRLVVYARAEHRDGDGPALRLQLAFSPLEEGTLVTHDEVHLVHEQKYGGIGGVLLQRIKTVTVVLRVFGCVARADFEDVDEHPDVLEDGRALRGEVRVHERVLASAVPEVEDEVAEEPDVVLLDIDGRAKARGERRGVV